MPRLARRKRDAIRFGDQTVWDVMMEAEYHHAIDEKSRKLIKSLIDEARTAPRYDVDEVYEYVFNKFKSDPEWRPRETPGIIPRHPKMFLEFRVSEQTNSTQDVRIGVILRHYTPSKASEMAMNTPIGDEESSSSVVRDSIQGHALSGHDIWIGTPILFKLGQILEPVAHFGFGVDRTHKVSGEIKAWLIRNLPDTDSNSAYAMASLASDISLATLGFLNCVNLEPVVVNPDREINKQRRKAHLKPFERYSRIVIDPSAGPRKIGGGTHFGGEKKGLHVVSGHIAHYNEDKPLFGRFVGTVFRRQHTRGDATRGTINSTYEVRAPLTRDQNGEPSS